MDLINHSIAGASTGYAFNKPLEGAIIAIIPDLVLGIKRKQFPTELYNLNHSLVFVLSTGIFYWIANGSSLVLFALFSHIILDLPTHGKIWAPPLFYPFNSRRYSFGKEWEWFSQSWWIGFILTIIWSLLWIFGSRLATGFQ